MFPSMEWISSIFLGFLVFSAVLQLFWSYALSAIAQQDEQSELMQVLAWVPILQIAPMIVAGGGSLPAFLLGSIGLMVAAIALGVVSTLLAGAVGGAVGGLCMIFLSFLVVAYFGRLFWTTAVNRDLSGWVGLLLFVPLVNFFVYPLIAFHDGWTPPNKVGLVLGLVLTLATAAPSYEVVRLMKQEGGLPPELSALMSGDPEMMNLLSQQGLEVEGHLGLAGISAAGTTHDEGPVIDSAAGIQALYSMQDRFERLQVTIESPDLHEAERKRRALHLLRSIESELNAYRGVLDGRTYRQLTTDLVEAEALIEMGEQEKRGSGDGISFAPTRPSPTPTRTDTQGGPAALAFSAKNGPAPVRPFPVRPDDECPDGTELRTRPGNAGEEEWCQQLDELGGLRHGWYAHYFESGQPESTGEYADGLRIGVWTRFYPTGRVRAQAEFIRGLQQGWLLSFDEAGERTKAVRFEAGAALP